MLRIDINGFKLSTENYPKRIVFEDGSPEFVFLSTVAALIRPANHLVNIRHKDMSVQSRAEFLLEGSDTDVSIALRSHELDQPCWFYRLPENPTRFEKFLGTSLVKHAEQQMNKQFKYVEQAGRGILLPSRTHERPARIELNVCSHVQQSNYKSTLFAQRLARCTMLAITELSANHAMLKQETPVAPIVKLKKLRLA